MPTIEIQILLKGEVYFSGNWCKVLCVTERPWSQRKWLTVEMPGGRVIENVPDSLVTSFRRRRLTTEPWSWRVLFCCCLLCSGLAGFRLSWVLS